MRMDEAAPRGARFRVGDRVRSRVSFADVRVGMLGIIRAIVVTSTITYVVSFADLSALRFVVEAALEHV
jgi:hypothetical protein